MNPSPHSTAGPFVAFGIFIIAIYYAGQVAGTIGFAWPSPASPTPDIALPSSSSSQRVEWHSGTALLCEHAFDDV